MPSPLSLVSITPNPFYPGDSGYAETADLVFKLAAAGKVWILIYNQRNWLVRTLAAGRRMKAGTHRITWDGTGNKGNILPVDLYTVRIITCVNSFPYFTATRLFLGSEPLEYHGNPVYAPQDQQAESPSVLFDKNRFGVTGGYPYLMWYDSPEPPGLVPRINMAVSFNGIDWSDQGTADGLTNPSHCSVLYYPHWSGCKFKMWYWNTAISDNIGAIRYAESADGLTWFNDRAVTQDSESRLVNISLATWNAFTFGPRCIIHNPGAPNQGLYPENYTYAMYYCVSPDRERLETALAYSSNGLHWKVAQNRPVLTGSDFGGEAQLDTQYTWDEYSVIIRSMIKLKSGLWFALYSAADDITGADKGIGFAYSADGLRWTKASGAHPLMHIDDAVPWRDSKTDSPCIVADTEQFSGFGDRSPAKIWFCGCEDEYNHGMNRFGIGYATLDLR